MKVKDVNFYHRQTRKPIIDPSVNFAIRWANAIERRMAKGVDFKEAANQTIKRADIEHIVGGWGFAHACRFLVDCWEHGEKLREHQCMQE